MPASVLVTGAGGFLGRELCLQLAPATAVIGVDLPQVKRANGVEWIAVDGASTLAQAVLTRQPALVIHAAFRNRKPLDWTEEQYITEAISDSLKLFDAVSAKGSKLLLVSSSAVYGNAGGREIIDEATPTQPVTAYGRAKAAVEDLAAIHARQGMKLSIARLFNLIGPREQPGMMLTDWVRQAAAIQNGTTDAIYVHHRRTARDFVDVRDATRALAMLATSFQSGEAFNVASGKAVSLMEISSELERLVGRQLTFVETSPEPDSSDVRSQRGSNAKLRAAVGWRPAIPWEVSLADLWRAVASGPNSAL